MNCEYILDSSAWAAYFDGAPHGEKIHLIIEHKRLGTSIIALAELADLFIRRNQAFDRYLQFIHSRSTVLPLTVPLALTAAKLKNMMRPKHQKFGIADGIHLATAQQEHATLVTADRDFSGMSDVLLL